jgi:hypothetical protein
MIDNLTPAQRDALANVRCPRRSHPDFGKLFVRKTHHATLRALVDKGAITPDGALTPDGTMEHQAICDQRGIKNGFDVMNEHLAAERKRDAKERERDVRVKAVAENFRGITVQPFTFANVEQDDVDLADEIVRAFAGGNSTTVRFTLDHLEAIAALVRRGKLVNAVYEVD